MHTSARLLMLTLVSATVAGCAGMGAGPGATARLEPTRGNGTAGTVRFVQQGDHVRVSGEVRGLAPQSEHGFHVHEKGDCSSGDGNSAGGHFNPLAKAHGQHGHGDHHTGDLPSLKADANGVARFTFESRSISVGSGSTDIVGRGLIVHAQPDDYATQPTGNAGARLACAVIQAK
ncbi:MAG: superoxide dismutase family protein [Comamonadaceae bacterium]|nr:MAG: superoxide dismutase family protein [Comamonadaceae bacterium]